jgi:hypothetical protein
MRYALSCSDEITKEIHTPALFASAAKEETETNWVSRTSNFQVILLISWARSGHKKATNRDAMVAVECLSLRVTRQHHRSSR